MLRLTTALILAATATQANPQATDILNDLRGGRPGVVYSPALEAIAQSHADDMARRGVLSHDSANGAGPGDRARAAGYGWCRIAENVAQGQTSLTQVMQGWFASPGHKKNMLDRNVTEFGLARAPGNYWVMVLARPGC